WREGLRTGQPLAEIVPVPGAALLGQRIGESEALALADRLADDVPHVGGEAVGTALVGVVAGHALVEDLLALGRIGFGEIGFDRLLGRPRTFPPLGRARGWGTPSSPH